MTEHFIPFRLHDLERLTLEGAPGGADFTKTTTLLHLLLRHEHAERLARLKDLYVDFDPNRDTQAVPGQHQRSDPVAFSHELKALLERANYAALSESELHEAFRTESVFSVKLHTELSDFRELTIYVRGRRQRQETIRSWLGWRKRTLDVPFFERVLIYIRFQSAEHFPEKRRKKLLFTPATTQLKLFANVPAADLEMLFPNSEVRMKTLDKLMIGVPAVFGIATMWLKIGLILGFLWAGLRLIGKHAGIHDQEVDIGTLAAQASLVLGACVAIYLFIGRQLMRYRFRKLQFIKALSDNLYFRNLDNNAGAFHRVVDEAMEEDSKEALVAYRFLAEGPATAAALDAKIESWFRQRLQSTVDFEVEDSLAKLERLGLARCEGTSWTAIGPKHAAQLLRERWSQLAPV